MNKQSGAWLLDCGGGMIVATGLANVLHVIEDTTRIFKIPLAPAHCNRVLLWQQRVLPAIDLGGLLADSPRIASRQYACVLGWRIGQTTEYGVLLAHGLPRQVAVSDEQQVAPSEAEAERWRGIALGFFAHYKRLTPIIDLAAMFGSTSQRSESYTPGAAHLIA